MHRCTLAIFDSATSNEPQSNAHSHRRATTKARQRVFWVYLGQRCSGNSRAIVWKTPRSACTDRRTPRQTSTNVVARAWRIADKGWHERDPDEEHEGSEGVTTAAFKEHHRKQCSAVARSQLGVRAGSPHTHVVSLMLAKHILLVAATSAGLYARSEATAQAP